jgi:mono/diheme cytochrome c family protein
MKTKRLLTWNLCVAGVSFLLGVAAFAGPLKIALPPETASFRAAPGAEAAMAHCLQCHSAEYITSQPPLGRDAWRASIAKMRSKYGAPVSPEAEAVLLDYLAGTYGTPLEPLPQK